jgi:hypothetical protein
MAFRHFLMPFFTADPARRLPARRPRRQLLAFLILVFLTVHIVRPVDHQPARSEPAPPGGTLALPPAWQLLAALLAGAPVRGAAGHAAIDPGHRIDLGQPAASGARAWAAALFGGHDLIMPSCLTQPPPAAPATATDAALPVRDDLPGFYGAPWTGHVGGDLIALLHVYAPRRAAGPVDAPTLQIYRHYDGRQVAPSFAATAPAAVYRGSRAVLYRAYPGGPVKCLDLVVPTGQSQGTAYLYYQEDHHYFERTARFAIQK